jgi:hypothetical protein
MRRNTHREPKSDNGYLMAVKPTAEPQHGLTSHSFSSRSVLSMSWRSSDRTTGQRPLTLATRLTSSIAV